MGWVFVFLIVILPIAIICYNVTKKIKSTRNSPPNVITSEDVKTRILTMISEDFSAMEGWSMWDATVHGAPGQFDRLERAVKEKYRVDAYDPVHRFAKVVGSNGDVYLTSCRRCSCPDYRERKLPCKHMYALALELEGNIEKEIQCFDEKRLYGLNVALAGRFSGSRDGADGIRAKLCQLGATWSDNIPRNTSALLCGDAPSRDKIQYAESLDMEVFSLESLDDYFKSSC